MYLKIKPKEKSTENGEKLSASGISVDSSVQEKPERKRKATSNEQQQQQQDHTPKQRKTIDIIDQSMEKISNEMLDHLLTKSFPSKSLNDIEGKFIKHSSI